MKVGILQCDEVLDKLQPQFGRYIDMIQHMFSGVDAELHFDVFDCRAKHFPDNHSSYDFFITTGSRHSAYDPEPWIPETIDFIKQLNEQRIKLIGICFGHQLIAKAFGYPVENSGKGWGIGVATNRVISSPTWMEEKPDQINIIVSHQDQVAALPENAMVIAESDFCPYFIVQWNDHFLSIQGHPEWTREYSRALMKERRSIIPEERLNRGLSSLKHEPDNHLFVGWIMDFLMNQNFNEKKS